MPNTPFTETLTQDYLDWQKEMGEVRPIKEYAEHLDIHKVTLSRLMNGNKLPTYRMLMHLAKKTGNPRYYDFANAPMPDPLLSLINQNWKTVPDEVQKQISDLLAPYVTDRRHVQKTTKSRNSENSA